MISETTASNDARICLDLGTAMSKASVWLGAEHGDVAPLPLGLAARSDHPLLTPSAMYVDDGRMFFGPAALERAKSGVASRRNPIVSFKLVLSAREIEPTLALKMSRSVDPTSTLNHRDGIVLYLAYLDQLIRAAVAADETLPAWVAEAPRRLTSPNWRSFEEAGRVVADLVDESVAVSREFGAALMGADGVALTRMRTVLDQARAAPSRGLFGGVVFESLSAASAYSNFARATDPFVLVIDMGAGTTDLAGFERNTAASTSGLAEVADANQCCLLAGDELDNILIDLFVRSGGCTELDAEDRLWRSVRLSAKSLKHDLFAKGRSAFKDRKKNLSLTRDELERDASFRAYCRALTQTIADSLGPLHARARKSGAKAITVLLAGGGSNLPFLAGLVRNAAARLKIKLKIKIERFGANWSLPHKHHPFAGVFPQLAIAMGGALAPVAQFAKREPVASPA